MANRKKVWFSFLSLDCLGVEKYLNQCAAQGWALAERSDCRTLAVTLEQSNRTDLCYSVSCDSLVRDQVFMREKVTQMQSLGWTPVATVNHFDIYESMPCRHPVPQKEQMPLALYLRSIGSFVLFLALSLCLLLLGCSRNIPIINEWYLSNIGVFLHFFGPILGAVGLCYFLWIGWRLLRRRSVWPLKRGPLILRGTLPVLAVIWLLLLTAVLVTDLVHHALYCLTLILVLVGALSFCYVRFRLERSEKRLSGVSMTLAVMIALSLVLNQVFPDESRAQLGACTWRNTLSDVVHGENVGLEGTSVEAVSYETKGSFLVKQTEYWEKWDNASLSSTVYRCKTAFFCQKVQQDLLKRREWQSVSSDYDGCWSVTRKGTYKLLLRADNTLILLSSDQELLPQLDAFSLELE